MDIWERIQAWYRNKGISTARFFDDNSTEIARDEMIMDFASKMLESEEKYSKLNSVATKTLMILRHSSISRYIYALENSHKNYELYKELSNPVVGDFVVESTTPPSGNLFRLFGYLRAIEKGAGVLGTDKYTIELLDGTICAWENCRFIKIKTEVIQ